MTVCHIAIGCSLIGAEIFALATTVLNDMANHKLTIKNNRYEKK